MHWICGVEHEAGYKLRLTFEDGSVRTVDLEDRLDGEVFEPLRDRRLFATARLNQDLDTVVWDNGADMSPDFLYEVGVPVERPLLAVAEKRAEYRTGKTR